ncbi:MAG: glycosyltransferase family 2 protein [Prevotellaceae bacterium]|nr:glycosyltransferase family 2 protein [Prevotellaceae bacterium]
MKLNIVIPCYNEEEVLPQTLVRMQALTERLKAEAGTEARILLVDDGSKDRTWELITEAAKNNVGVCALKLSHNEGHQNALWAGMEQGVDTCDAMVSIDADLQDDENAIIDMAQQINEGKDIVYGVRRERRTDTWFKRFSAEAFYKLMKRVDDEIIFNHADFRMMSNRAVKALMAYPERNLFLRGIVRQLGFQEGYVYYDRKAREAGDSKYPLKKMIAFSVDGITSFSVAPLRFITCMGIIMTFMAFVFIVYALVRNFEGETIQGWTSLLVSLWFIGGIVTTSIGITGLYVGKIYIEVKHRPRYFIEQRLNL